MERVVDRSQLLSEDDLSAPSSPETDHLKSLQEFDFVKHDPTLATEQQEASEHEELDFVLFAPTVATGDTSGNVAKIRVHTPPPATGEPGFIVPSRHRDYYFARSAIDDARRNFEAAAVSGHDILTRSHSLWPGSRYGWKVFHVPTSKRQRALLSVTTTGFEKFVDSHGVAKHKRLGKKARLKVRTKIAAAKAQQRKKQEDAELREAAERDKRTRRNREKKVKKKQRDKAKKEEAGAAPDESMSMPD